MRFANIYIPWRRCEGDPTGICLLPGTIADRRPVSERGLGEDITNDGDAEDSNNTFAAAPCKQPMRASEPSYSALWAVNNGHRADAGSPDRHLAIRKVSSSPRRVITERRGHRPMPSPRTRPATRCPAMTARCVQLPVQVPATHPLPCGG
jgi:hypothetical protein